MSHAERSTGSDHEKSQHLAQSGLDVPSLETALHSSPETRIDWHLGPGVVFRFGAGQASSLELYSQVVRVELPHAELAIRRREPQVAADGIVFEYPEHFFLSVGPRG